MSGPGYVFGTGAFSDIWAMCRSQKHPATCAHTMLVSLGCNLEAILHWWKIVISDYILLFHQMIKMIFLWTRTICYHAYTQYSLSSVFYSQCCQQINAWILQPNDSIFHVISTIFSMTGYVYVHLFRNIFGVTFYINISVTDTHVQAESIKSKATCPLCGRTALGVLTFRLDCLPWSTGPHVPKTFMALWPYSGGSSPAIKAMVCRQFGAKTVPQLLIAYIQLDHWKSDKRWHFN